MNPGEPTFTEVKAVMRQVDALIGVLNPYEELRKLSKSYEDLGRDDLAECVFYLHSICKSRDAQMSKPPVTNIYGNVANLNTGHQVGTINASILILNQQGAKAQELATAVDAIKGAVLQATDVEELNKKKVLDSLSLISTEAQKPEDERHIGILEPVLAKLPILLQSAVSLSTLWHTYGAHILSFFGSMHGTP
jgi:hypothetical protein